MSTPPKPMLAAKDIPLDQLRYPGYVSPKLDGVRAIVWDGVVYSRSLKVIPNAHVQKRFGRKELHGLDGELIVGSPTAPDVFNKTTSVTSSHDHASAFVDFYAFEHINESYQGTSGERANYINQEWSEGVEVVDQAPVNNADELLQAQMRFEAMGYEGAMYKPADTTYKHGRATAKGQELVKLKRFEDAEAVVVGYEELMRNENAQEVNELGGRVRSSKKAGLVPGGVLGALVCVLLSDWEAATAGERGWLIDGPLKEELKEYKTYVNKVTFKIGTGLDAQGRYVLWQTRKTLAGSIVKFKHQPHGKKDKPRLPVFLGFRAGFDL